MLIDHLFYDMGVRSFLTAAFGDCNATTTTTTGMMAQLWKTTVVTMKHTIAAQGCHVTRGDGKRNKTISHKRKMGGGGEIRP